VVSKVRCAILAFTTCLFGTASLSRTDFGPAVSRPRSPVGLLRRASWTKCIRGWRAGQCAVKSGCRWRIGFGSIDLTSALPIASTARLEPPRGWPCAARACRYSRVCRSIEQSVPIGMSATGCAPAGEAPGTAWRRRYDPSPRNDGCGACSHRYLRHRAWANAAASRPSNAAATNRDAATATWVDPSLAPVARSLAMEWSALGLGPGAMAVVDRLAPAISELKTGDFFCCKTVRSCARRGHIAASLVCSSTTL